jgi:hypothetical protein
MRDEAGTLDFDARGTLAVRAFAMDPKKPDSGARLSRNPRKNVS